MDSCNDLKFINDTINSLWFKKQLLLEEVDKIQTTIIRTTDRLEALEKTKSFILDIAQKTQSEIRTYIEETVTLALVSVFGEEYQFKIELSEKRDQQEAHFFVQKDDILLEPREDTQGGSIIDVCSIGLRMACWALESNTEAIMLLDEPCPFIGQQKIEQIGLILKKLSEILKIQMIIITHKEELATIADKTIRIGE